MTIQEKYHFDYRKVDDRLRRQIASIAETASRNCNRHFHPLSSIFGRVLLCLIGEMIFLPLLSTRRPPHRKVVAFRDSDFFDPSSNSNEYLALAKALGVSTEEEAVIYYLVTQFDFAVVEKQSMPARIADERDARQFGFALEAMQRELLQQGFSLWWQEWGGVLSKCRFAEMPTFLVSSFEPVGYGIGRFKRLPTSLVR